MATLTLEAVMDTAKIERIRREVAKGTYLTEEKFDAAISQISAKLGLDNQDGSGYDSERIDEQPSRSSVLRPASLSKLLPVDSLTFTSPALVAGLSFALTISDSYSIVSIWTDRRNKL
jgi:hypothetical protein